MMKELTQILINGFSLLIASILILAIVLYIKLSNLEDIISNKFEKENNNEK